MSKSRFLTSLTPSQREELIRRLWDHQGGKCYISGEPIDLQVHEVDLDHIIALSRGGIDDESNIGLAQAHYNRSKGVRDLELQRRIFRFYKDLEERQSPGQKTELFSVGDVPDLEIMKFVETVSARSRRYPISYDTLKNLVDVFLFRNLADEPVAETDVWRLREKENIGRLLEMLAAEALAGRFKLELGVYKLDEKLEQNPQGIPIDHLRAYRLFRKPALKVWAETLRDSMCQYLVIKNKYKKNWYKERPLWADIDVEEWEAVRRGIKAIVGHKVWAETQKDLVSVLASTRQKDWASILLEGKLPSRPEKKYQELNVAAVINAMANL